MHDGPDLASLVLIVARCTVLLNSWSCFIYRLPTVVNIMYICSHVAELADGEGEYLQNACLICSSVCRVSSLNVKRL